MVLVFRLPFLVEEFGSLKRAIKEILEILGSDIVFTPIKYYFCHLKGSDKDVLKHFKEVKVDEPEKLTLLDKSL